MQIAPASSGTVETPVAGGAVTPIRSTARVDRNVPSMPPMGFA
jgi:hypothetical protein